ncbi:MAG: hypothetical protein WC657_04995 [Candidatus Paceibacterota bacterium]|jgi:hypothetical protein
MEQYQGKDICLSVFNKENIIDRGTRSICYRKGDKVLKVMSGFVNENAANEVVEEMTNSRNTLVHWLGEYVTPSQIEMSGKTGSFQVVIEQPFISGMSLKKAIELAERDNLNIDRIIDFLKRTQNMYKSTNQVPDIFGRPHVLGWYQGFSTPNVRVELNGGILFPKLLDIGFARLSLNKITKSIHNSLLAKSIDVAIEKTKNRVM